MADRENPDVQDEGTDNKPTDKAPVVDPIRGLKKANKTLSQERDNLANELKKLKDEAEKAKLSESERSAATLKQIEKERDEARAEALRAKAEREQERKISQMVAKHGLRDADFGELVLKQYNPDEHDDFDGFVNLVKKNKKFEPLFVKQEDAERVTDEDGNDIEPTPPRPNKSKTGAKQPSAEHEEFARKQFPGDEARQKAYLANIAALGKGR